MRIAFCQEVHLAPVRNVSLELQDSWLKSEPVRFPIAGATITFVRASFSSICISDMSLYFHRAVGARWPGQPTNFFFLFPRFCTRGFRRVSSRFGERSFAKRKNKRTRKYFCDWWFYDECWLKKVIDGFKNFLVLTCVGDNLVCFFKKQNWTTMQRRLLNNFFCKLDMWKVEFIF